MGFLVDFDVFDRIEKYERGFACEPFSVQVRQENAIETLYRAWIGLMTVFYMLPFCIGRIL